MSDIEEIITQGLRDGLKARIASIFQNLAQAGETEREHRFRNGVEASILAYDRAQKIVAASLQESMGD